MAGEIEITYPFGADTNRRVVARKANKLQTFLIHGRADRANYWFEGTVTYTPLGEAEESSVKSRACWTHRPRGSDRVIWMMRVKFLADVPVNQTASLLVKGFRQDGTASGHTTTIPFTVVSRHRRGVGIKLDDISIVNFNNNDNITADVDGVIAMGDLTGAHLKTAELKKIAPTAGSPVDLVSWFSDPDDLQAWAVQFDAITQPATGSDTYSLYVEDYSASHSGPINLIVDHS